MFDMSNDSMRSGSSGSSKDFLQLLKYSLGVRALDAKPLIEIQAGVLFDKIDEVALDALLRHDDVDAAAALFGEVLFEQLAVLEIDRHMGLSRRVVAHGVVLLERLPHERAGVERVAEVFPEELAFADNFALAHGKERERELPALAVIAERVDVFVRHNHHLLLLPELLYGAQLVAVARGRLEAQLVGGARHALLEVGFEVRRLALKQRLHVAHGFVVLFERA